MNILGLPGLSPTHRDKVSVGNRLMRVTARLARAALQLHVPGSVESPSSSRLWHAPPFVRLGADDRVISVTFDFCAFGTRWRKRTRVLFWCLNLQALNVRCCSRKGM